MPKSYKDILEDERNWQEVREFEKNDGYRKTFWGFAVMIVVAMIVFILTS